MADEGNVDAGQQQQEESEQRRIQVRDTASGTAYSNFFTVSGGNDAVMVGFGSAFGGENQVRMENKIALSWRNAKRLALSLGQVIRRYESERGEIDIGGQQQPPAQPEAASEEG